MKTKYFFIAFLLLTVLLVGCRKEEMELIESPQENTLVAGSNVADLMKRTATNDGSNDNIIDYANCFNIQFPYTVIANSVEVIINNMDDLYQVENIFDEVEDDTDTLAITYPITIILTDFTEVVIYDYSQLSSYASNCNGENVIDDDIECLDFVYPIVASVFNLNNELIETISILNDNALYDFIDEINESLIVTISFPIQVLLPDGTELTINNLNELELAIINYSDSCDEDDDYDYNDDDCNNCTQNQLESILTGCSNWVVDKLKRSNVNYDDLYDRYDFNFSSTGTVLVYYDSNNYYGTWSTSGSGNNITVVIDLPDFPLCNNNWRLHEIQESSGETKVDLRVGDDDRLRYENPCN